MILSKSIVLVDSDCALCNTSVNFILKHGGENKFEFISIFSPEGKKVLNKINLPENYDQSLVLVENGKIFVKSTAVLRIFKKLSGIYPLIYGFIVVPRQIRDFFYMLISKHRHKLGFHI